MKKILFLLPVLALAACGQEPAPEPAPSTAAPVAAATPTLPAPDQATFTAAFAAACEGAEPVNTAVCKRAGMGSPDILCEYGLGEDTYLRHEATLNPGDGQWVLAEPEKICAEHGAHHKS